MPGRPPIRVALVEDHAATREALVSLLADAPDRVELVSAFARAEQLLEQVEQLRPAVALIDLQLPGMCGSALISALRRASPSTRALALTGFNNEERVVEAIQAGASGYLLKDEPTGRLLEAIEEVADGANPISSRVAGFLLARARAVPAPIALTDREEQLASALVEGLSYAECGARMGIALGTVQDYVKRLYRKLDVSSKRELRDRISGA
jgi:DNA-binding NarL/FixJ family response regulator